MEITIFKIFIKGGIASDIGGVIKKFSVRYALVRFAQLKSLPVGHLILLKDI